MAVIDEYGFLKIRRNDTETTLICPWRSASGTDNSLTISEQHCEAKCAAFMWPADMLALDAPRISLACMHQEVQYVITEDRRGDES
jgi:hypothetical protein